MSEYSAVIIDDNPLNNDVLVALLERYNVKTIAIQSPTQFDETLEKIRRPTMIFLDLEFPNYDGFDVLQTLRANPLLDQTPIIAYSVHTSEIDRARQAGFDGFLGKPLNAQRFEQNLNNILDGESIWEI